jgi:hypothetical protein
MKNIYRAITLSLSFILLFTTSCKDYLDDVANDPNNPLVVPNNLILGGLLGNFSYQVLAGDPARNGSYWINYTAFTGVPPTSDNYDVDEADINNLWTYFSYTAVMNNARILADQATEQGSYHYAGIGRVILAWNMSIVTDLWDEVPYSEAWQPEKTVKPKYDTQESIYIAIQSLLDQAIADFEKTSLQSPSADDLLYPAGTAAAWVTNSLPKWKRLAYTLKARFYMRLTNAPGYDPVTQSNLALTALQNGFSSNGDNALFQYYDEERAQNPWHQFTNDDIWDDNTRLSDYYVNKLADLNDPRITVQAEPAEIGSTPDAPVFRGARNGRGDYPDDSISSIGGFYRNADAPLQWLTFAEAKFLQAEATLRTQGAAAAQPIYEEGIAASFEDLGLSAEDAESYISALPLLSDVNSLEQVINQKYIALFLQFESYNDWRRTGFPNDIPLAENARTNIIPLRFPYPQTELLNNAEEVAKTGTPLGYSSLEKPVWWDR